MTLRARGLVRRFGAIRAVDSVDLDVAAGEVVGLLGPNGAGKSTMFALLAGLQRPDAGHVWLDDTDITRWPLHRRARAGLAFLPQHPSLLPGLTVRDNVVVALTAVGRPGADADGRLAQQGLAHLADRRAADLSGGERRRVELVRALALDPRVLVLDEPFSGVDPIHVAELADCLRALAAAGRAVLLTDHAARDALRTCDRAYLMDGGAIIATGSPDRVAREPRARARYFGESFEL